MTADDTPKLSADTGMRFDELYRLKGVVSNLVLYDEVFSFSVLKYRAHVFFPFSLALVRFPRFARDFIDQNVGFRTLSNV
jgi:hypothetical protein